MRAYTYDGKATAYVVDDDYCVATSHGIAICNGKRIQTQQSGLLLGTCINGSGQHLILANKFTEYPIDYGTEVKTSYLIWSVVTPHGKVNLSSPLIANADFWDHPAGWTSAACTDEMTVVALSNGLLVKTENEHAVVRNPLLPIWFDRKNKAWVGRLPQVAIAAVGDGGVWGVWAHNSYLSAVVHSRDRATAIYFSGNATSRAKGADTPLPHVKVEYGRKWDKLYIDADPPYALVLKRSDGFAVMGCNLDGCVKVRCVGGECEVFEQRRFECDAETICGCVYDDLTCGSTWKQAKLGKYTLRELGEYEPEAVVPIHYDRCALHLVRKGGYPYKTIILI